MKPNNKIQVILYLIFFPLIGLFGQNITVIRDTFEMKELRYDVMLLARNETVVLDSISIRYTCKLLDEFWLSKETLEDYNIKSSGDFFLWLSNEPGEYNYRVRTDDPVMIFKQNNKKRFTISLYFKALNISSKLYYRLNFELFLHFSNGETVSLSSQSAVPSPNR
jgi:hypothetical protein